MRRACLALAILALVSGRAHAQEHPNFSGLWTQNMAKSSKTSLQRYANKIELTGNALKVTTIMDGSRGESSFDKTYEIGQESTSADKEGDQFTSVVNWDGQSLVFVTTEKEKSGTIETREVWTLSADGNTLTKIRRSHGPRGDSEQTYVLEKTGA
jgi:hypothetical protein